MDVGAKVNWDFQISDLVKKKTLMEPIFNPCGEFRWSPEGPVSQIHSPLLHVGAPGIFSDLLRSVQMLKREWGARSYRTYPSLVKLGFWVCGGRPAFEQNCSLGSCDCSEGPAFGQNTHDDDDDDDDDSQKNVLGQ